MSAPVEAVRFLAKVLDEYGYGTKQGDKDAALIASRLKDEGWLRVRRVGRAAAPQEEQRPDA